jgi:hypothetical protein
MKKSNTRIFTLLLAAIPFVYGCKKDHDHDHDHEEVNKIRITFKNATNSSDSVVVSADLSRTPFVVDSLKLSRGVVYQFSVQAFDNTGNKMEDVTPALKREANVHLFLFCAEGGKLGMTKTDLDNNGRATGFSGNVTATEVGDDRLKIRLLHDAKKAEAQGVADCDIINNVNQAGNKVGGETDFETTLPVKIM